MSLLFAGSHSFAARLPSAGVPQRRCDSGWVRTLRFGRLLFLALVVLAGGAPRALATLFVTGVPANTTVTAGSIATFTAAATGDPAPTAQWQVSANGGISFSNLPGATSSHLNFTAEVADNGYQYRVIFANVSGSDITAGATLTVDFGPTVLTNPFPASVVAGATATFTAAATGNPAPTVQWRVYRGGILLSNIAGATSPTLSFPAQLTDNGKRYGAVFSNSVSSVSTSDALLTVIPGPATHFLLTAPAYVTAGAGFDLTVTALDQYNNTATGYVGTVYFTSSDGQAVLPANFSLLHGIRTFNTTLKTAGSQTITATDTAASGLTGTSGTIAVTPAAAASFVVAVPGHATAGTAFTTTVTALDAFHNTATGYSGTMHFTTTDGLGVLPADSTLSSGAGTFSATLKTAGSQTITVTDTVRSHLNGTSAIISVSPAAAAYFVVAAPINTVAGNNFTLTVTAFDPFSNFATNYAGTVHFTATDAQAVLPADAPLTNGAATFSATLDTAGTQTITATDTTTPALTGTSGTIAVTPAAAASFVVAVPGHATAGTAFTTTVTALDAFHNTATGYSGTMHFTTTDGLGVLPADSTLSSGAGTFSATLKTAGSQTITVTDTVRSLLNGTSAIISVSPAAAAYFVVAAPTNTVAGTNFTLTVTAFDPFSNFATNYAGTVHFTATDAQAVLPADAPLTNGAATFSATLDTAGTQTITATDTTTPALTGTSASVSVSAAATAVFLVSVPPGTVAGTSFSLTVTALDPFNNLTTNYAGTVHFTSTDVQAVLPADATLINGVATFSATLDTAGTQTITAIDTTTSTITGTSGNLNVSPAAAAYLSVIAPANTVAGTALTFYVVAMDPFSNIATGYSGTIHFTATDAQAVLPADATLTSGTGTFSATLITAGAQTITATDTSITTITGTSSAISVSPAAATHLTVSAPATTTAGTPVSVTVTALDAYNNTVSDYPVPVHFTATDTQAVLPADTLLTGGTGTFSTTLETAGVQTITATSVPQIGEFLFAITGTSGAICVAPAAAASFLVSAPVVVKAHFPTNFTVTAQDPFGNTATGYAGTVHFTSSDDLAALPADSALTNGSGAFSVTLATAGLQNLTATDTVNSLTGSSSAIEVLDLKIVVPPASQYVLVGSNAVFSVGVSGTAPFAYQWQAAGVPLAGATNCSLTVSNITLLTATNYQVIVTNAWGCVTSSVAVLTASGVFSYPPAQSATLNLLTGLYEETVTVTNVSGPASGFRLLVGGLPARVSLYNVAGTNNGLPYAQFAVTLASGQTSTFLLQFFNPYRLNFTNTVQVVALAAGLGGDTATTNTATGITISQVLMDTTIPGSPRFTLAFASVVGTNYQVLYSDDSMQTWTLADTLTASSTWTIWTELLPPASGSRLFKVVVLPSGN